MTTAATVPEDHRRSLLSRRWVRVAAVVAAVAGLLLAALLVWSAPRSDVAVPGPDAKPADVVLAYIEAVNERDFDTANAIRPSEDLGRFSRPMRIADVSEIRVQRLGRRVHVTFTADITETDISMDEGRQWWGYVLERGEDGRWVIVDSGVA